jgi:hypothetical protein
MNQLDAEKQAQVLFALVEGNSISSICRMFKVGKNTVARLLLVAGQACAQYQNKALRNLLLRVEGVLLGHRRRVLNWQNVG